jgi:hypothetical protein
MLAAALKRAVFDMVVARDDVVGTWGTEQKGDSSHFRPQGPCCGKG